MFVPDQLTGELLQPDRSPTWLRAVLLLSLHLSGRCEPSARLVGYRWESDSTSRLGEHSPRRVCPKNLIRVFRPVVGPTWLVITFVPLLTSACRMGTIAEIKADRIGPSLGPLWATAAAILAHVTITVVFVAKVGRLLRLPPDDLRPLCRLVFPLSLVLEVEQRNLGVALFGVERLLLKICCAAR